MWDNKQDYIPFSELSTFCGSLADGKIRAGLPVLSLIFSWTAAPYICEDSDDDVVQTTCKEWCLENEAASSENDGESDLDWSCPEVEIDTGVGWEVEDGGVLGPTRGERRGEILGDTLEWGDDGALVEYPLPSEEVCHFLVWSSDLSNSFLIPSLKITCKWIIHNTQHIQFS